MTAKPQDESPILDTPDPTKRHFDINENTEVAIPDLVARDQEKMFSSLYWELPKSYLPNEYFELDGSEGEGKREFDGNRTALYFKNSPNFESDKLDYNATLYIRDSAPESEIEPTSVTFSFSIKNVSEAPRPKLVA